MGECPQGSLLAMTVTYIQHVHTAKSVGAFFRLLAIWRGGVFKGIWKDLLFYLLLYTGISLGYRFGLTEYEDVKSGFERICVFLDRFGDYIPLGFILGFYVTQVVNRWWTQCLTIPWLDTLCMNLASFMPGDESKATRRLITRYAMLANILTLRRISNCVASRFPTYEHLVEMGLLTTKELKRLEQLDHVTEGLHATTWYPIKWAQEALKKANKEGKIAGELLFKELHMNLLDISGKNGTMLMYAWINIPLVYTQLVTIAVHIYFLVCLLGRQYLTPTRYVGAAGDYVPVPSGTPNSVNLVGYDDSILDFYVPFFTILQFIFYFGWLKVAETLINPFGNDDDDIDVNYIIDRNFQIGFFMVTDDQIFEETEEDPYGDKIPPPTLPHTINSLKTKEPAPILPTDNILLSENEDEDGMVLVDNEAANQLEHNAPRRKLSTKSLNVFQRKLSIKSNISGDKSEHSTTIDMIKARFQSHHMKSKPDDYDMPVINEPDETSLDVTETQQREGLNGL